MGSDSRDAPSGVLAVLDILCMVLPIILFLTPVTVFWEARKTQRRVEMPPLALTSQLIQCYLWIIYASGWEEAVMLIPNVIGAGLAAIFLVLYQRSMNPIFQRQFRSQTLGCVVVGFCVRTVSSYIRKDFELFWIFEKLQHCFARKFNIFRY